MACGLVGTKPSSEAMLTQIVHDFRLGSRLVYDLDNTQVTANPAFYRHVAQYSFSWCFGSLRRKGINNIISMK